MNTQEFLEWLKYPAYGLFHLDTLSESASGDYLYDIVPTFNSKFSPNEQQAILMALEWAINTPHLDFSTILPELPHSNEFKREHFRITRERILASRQAGSNG